MPETFFRHIPSLFSGKTKRAAKSDLEKTLSETIRLDSHNVVTSGSFGRGEKIFGWFLSSAPRIVVVSIDPPANDRTTFHNAPKKIEGSSGKKQGRIKEMLVSKKVVDLKNVLSVSFHEEFSAMSMIYQHDSSRDVDILLIPGISGFDQFSDVQHYFLLTRRQSQLSNSNGNPMCVKWSGTQTVHKKLVIWVVSDKHVALAPHDDESIQVPLFHVYDISFKVPEDDQEKGTLQISYVYADFAVGNSYRERDASVLLSSLPDCYTIQKATIQLEAFGNESDFDEISLLWRQQVQLRMMQDVLDGKQATQESDLAQKCRELLKEKSSLSQPQPTNGWRSSLFLPHNESVLPRHAESMWKIVGTMEQPIELSQIQRKLSKKRQLLKTIEADVISTTEHDDLDTVQESLEELLDFSYLSLDRSNSRRLESSLTNRSKESPRKPVPTPLATPSSSPVSRPLSPLEKLKKRIKRLSGQILYRATFDYDATGPGELTLKTCDRVRVIKKDASGWWYCSMEPQEDGSLLEEVSEKEARNAKHKISYGLRRAYATAEKLKAPSSDEINIASNPKIDQIVSSISKLTLLETAQLVKVLKEELNIQDAFMAMPMAAHGAVAGQAAASPAQEAEPEKPAEKTEFTVKLDKFDAAVKAKVIRELKNILPGANLVEAKKFAESAPKVIRDKVPKEEAEKIKKVLEAVGATVTLE